ncbi:MAG: hypothetical protein P0S95_04430 [Rhabdochlamydiaceae bacterium]|nr:hypothetical protein [Candidatus Amphrikana amoebophyrae]
MSSISDGFKKGLVVRVFRNGVDSLLYEASPPCAAKILCGSLIKQGVPIFLINQLQGRKLEYKCGFIYDTEYILIARAFKKDVFSNRFNSSDLKEVEINKKTKVPIPRASTGEIKYHRDYKTVKALSEKVSRMFEKYKKQLPYSEVLFTAKNSTLPKKRIIGILVDDGVFKDLQVFADITTFAMQHLPNLPFCRYESDGTLEVIPLEKMKEMFFNRLKDMAERELSALTTLRSKL